MTAIGTLVRGWLAVCVAVLGLAGCQIQPPLNLAEDKDIVLAFGDVIIDIDVIWGTDSTWRDSWWYGWDDNDIRRWGDIAYPDPTSFEARFYYYGDGQGSRWTELDRLTAYERLIHRRFQFGNHDMLIWSNIDSHDGTQALIVDETEPDNVHATTSRSRLTYALPPASRGDVYNHPEIFYRGYADGIYISQDIDDYDYYDEQLGAWVKRIHTDLYPLVYIYMVQVVIYNNHGRITALTDDAALDNLADGVHVKSGRTHNTPVVVKHGMGFKRDLPARDGRPADIFGGKLTTFGLCDMEPWQRSRATQYKGSRADLRNRLSVPLQFSNMTDSAYYYDVTDQVQRQAHGGIITIEIDADTLRVPVTGAGSQFDPVIQNPDSIWHEFPI